MSLEHALEIIRIALAAGIVLANVAVWIGVYLENERFSKAIQGVGWRTLLYGLTAESMLSLLLLITDTTLNNIQQHTILALRSDIVHSEEQVARIKAPRSLSVGQTIGIANVLKIFRGITCDFSLISSDPEASGLLKYIHRPLTDAGWTQIPWRGGLLQSAPGWSDVGAVAVPDVDIVFDSEDASTLAGPASALVQLLRNCGISTDFQHSDGKGPS